MVSKQTVVTARMPFIRAGHTEVGDGTCGLCDLVWPCDAGTVLMALAAATQRADAAEQRAAALTAVLRDIRDLADSDQSDTVIACTVGAWAQDALAASGGAAPAVQAGGE